MSLSHEESGCRSGKVGHETRAQAMMVLERVLRRGRWRKRGAKKKRPDGLSAYRCPRCGLWHIGNSGRRMGQ